jgi:hypothetical protein
MYTNVIHNFFILYRLKYHPNILLWTHWRSSVALCQQNIRFLFSLIIGFFTLRRPFKWYFILVWGEHFLKCQSTYIHVFLTHVSVPCFKRNLSIKWAIYLVKCRDEVVKHVILQKNLWMDGHFGGVW